MSIFFLIARVKNSFAGFKAIVDFLTRKIQCQEEIATKSTKSIADEMIRVENRSCESILIFRRLPVIQI